MAAVLFLFVSFLTACSGDDAREVVPSGGPGSSSPSLTDYQSVLTAHDWEVTLAAQRLYGFLFDLRDASTFCHFSPDSIFFTELEVVSDFDEEGKVTHTQYECSPIGTAPYTLSGNHIMIGDTDFTLADSLLAADSVLVLDNEGWRLVLQRKQSDQYNTEKRTHGNY